MDNSLKQYYYFLAVKDIAELFAETELGSNCEIDVEAVVGYINSYNFFNDTWGSNTKEEIYQHITDDILNGYPIWRLLKLPDWTMNMLEREFNTELDKERERLRKKYKCYTCKYFKSTTTSLGDLNRCNNPDKYGKRFKLRRDDTFEFRQKCKYYEKKEESS